MALELSFKYLQTIAKAAIAEACHVSINRPVSCRVRYSGICLQRWQALRSKPGNSSSGGGRNVTMQSWVVMTTTGVLTQPRMGAAASEALGLFLSVQADVAHSLTNLAFG